MHSCLDETISLLRNPSISASPFCSRRGCSRAGAVSAQHHREEVCTGKGWGGPPAPHSEPWHGAGLGHVAPRSVSGAQLEPHTHTLCPMCTLQGLFPPCTVLRGVNTSHVPAWVSQSTAPRALLMSRLFEKSLFSTTLASREMKCNLMCYCGTKTPDLPCPPSQVSPADVPRPAWLWYLTASSHLPGTGLCPQEVHNPPSET